MVSKSAPGGTWWPSGGRGLLLYVLAARHQGLGGHHLSKAFHLIPEVKGISVAILSVCPSSFQTTSQADHFPGVTGMMLLVLVAAVHQPHVRAEVADAPLPELGASPAVSPGCLLECPQIAQTPLWDIKTAAVVPCRLARGGILPGPARSSFSRLQLIPAQTSCLPGVMGTWG